MREELGPELADELQRRGLAAPARLLLDAHRPLMPLLGAVATFLSPVTDLVMPGGRDRFGELLADGDAVSRLVDRLGRPREERGG